MSDIFPTGYHGAVTAGVTTGSTVYVAGAGPVGLACAAACHLLGAAVVIVGDMIDERLEQARSFGCETVDLKQDSPLPEMIADIVGVPEVDSAVDCVGFEAHGHGHEASEERPATVLNQMMQVARAGGGVGIPGLYVTEDPGAADEASKFGNLSIRIGLGWAKSLHFHTGQCPVMKYHRGLMMAILYDKVQIAKAVNVTVISLEDAAGRLQGLRPRRRQEVRARSPRHAFGVTRCATTTRERVRAPATNCGRAFGKETGDITDYLLLGSDKSVTSWHAYGQRWQVETVNSILRRLSDAALRARRYWTQYREIFFRTLTLNMMILR